MSDRWATFDCYGTLIDWHGGIAGTLARLWPEADTGELLATYHRLEPQVQAGNGMAYREVMAQTLSRLAVEEDLTLRAEDRDALGESLPTWRAFPEVPDAMRRLRADGWRLGILSNTDPDFLDASLATIDTPVEVRVVASDIGSYKPAFGHWETFFRRTGAHRARHVHVAASLFHDVAPCAQLGLPCVWIDRQAETSALPRAGRLPDLTELPATLQALVPA